MNLKLLKPLVNNHDLWKTLDSYLEFCYNMTNIQIDTAEGQRLHQLQGERQFINKLRKLKETVNNAQ